MLKDELKLALKNAIEDSNAKTAVIKQLEEDATKTPLYQVLLGKYTTCSNALISALATNVEQDNEIASLKRSLFDREQRIQELASEVATLTKATKDWAEMARTFTCSRCESKEPEEVQAEEPQPTAVIGRFDNCPSKSMCLCKYSRYETPRYDCLERMPPVEEVQEVDPEYVTWHKLADFYENYGGSSIEEFVALMRKE